MGQEAMRFNEGKPELGYVMDMAKGIEMLAVVMQQGAIKYEPGNWLKGGKPDSEYIDSALRHIVAFRSGEEYDRETGCHHLAHAAWNMLALLTVNREDEELMDPNFDQERFLETYNDKETAPFKVGDRVVDVTGAGSGSVYAISDDGELRIDWDGGGLDPTPSFWPASDFKHE